MTTKLTPEEKISLISILKAIPVFVEDSYERRLYGICANVDEAITYDFCGSWPFLEVEEYLDSVFKAWPKYSGNELYPVPSPVEGLSSREAYQKLFRWGGEYGKLRRELLDFCIKYIMKDVEKDIKNLNKSLKKKGK